MGCDLGTATLGGYGDDPYGAEAGASPPPGTSDDDASAGPAEASTPPPNATTDASGAADATAARDAGNGPAPDGGETGGPVLGDAATAPLRVFIDTDLVWDPNDISALTMAHGLADDCEIQIIATTVVSTSAWAGSTADAINTYYGRGDIPVGVLQPGSDGSFLDPGDGFAKNVSMQFPNKFLQGAPAPDAVAVFRQVLAAQPDQSVHFASIGPMRNLQHFLESPPDGISPLSGTALVAAKVVELTAMGGVFADIGAFGGPVTAEWNILQDVSSAAYVVAHWPTPIVFSGFELGWYMCQDVGMDTSDPASPVAFVMPGDDPTPCGPGNGRPSWDNTAILHAARGLGGYWTGDATGSVAFRVPGGEDQWSATPDKHQGFLVNPGVDTTADESSNRALMAKSAVYQAMVELEQAAGKKGACVAKK